MEGFDQKKRLREEASD
jgi:hypothetical protein